MKTKIIISNKSKNLEQQTSAFTYQHNIPTVASTRVNKSYNSYLGVKFKC